MSGAQRWRMSSNFLFQCHILYSCCLATCVALISPITFLVDEYMKFSLIRNASSVHCLSQELLSTYKSVMRELCPTTAAFVALLCLALPRYLDTQESGSILSGNNGYVFTFIAER